jgi:hypothetical protein
MTLTNRQHVKQIAARVLCDDRTARAFLEGRRVMPSIERACRVACAELRIPAPAVTPPMHTRARVAGAGASEGGEARP